LAGKGRIVDLESLSRTISRRFAQQEAVVRFCVNGLIVVGLMGTLYNLWRFGPDFWRSLGDPNAGDANLGIGIAFAASLCGIGLALGVSFLDILVIRPRTDRVAREGAAVTARLAAERLPATQDALLQQAVAEFAARAETIVADASRENARLTQVLIASLDRVTGTLDSHSRELSQQWQRFFGEVSKRLEEGTVRVIATTGQLAGATQRAAETLDSVTRTLASYKGLSDLVVLVKEQSVELVTKVTAELDRFSQDTRTTLSEVARQHADSLRAESDEANRRLSDLVDAWHSRSAQTLTSFQAEMRRVTESLGQQWAKIFSSLGAEGDRLLARWTDSLTRSSADVRLTTEALGQRIQRLDGALLRIVDSGEAVAKSVGALQASFSSLQASVATWQSSALAESAPRAAQSPAIETLLKTQIDRLDRIRAQIADQPAPPAQEPVADALRRLEQTLSRLPSEVRRAVETALPRHPLSHLAIAAAASAPISAQPQPAIAISPQPPIHVPHSVARSEPPDVSVSAPPPVSVPARRGFLDRLFGLRG
jgi:hypothetical protein